MSYYKLEDFLPQNPFAERWNRWKNSPEYDRHRNRKESYWHLCRREGVLIGIEVFQIRNFLGRLIPFQILWLWFGFYSSSQTMRKIFVRSN